MPGVSNVNETGSSLGTVVESVQLPLLDLTLCEASVPSNSHRTVSPVVTAMLAGLHVESCASMTWVVPEQQPIPLPRGRPAGHRTPRATQPEADP